MSTVSEPRIITFGCRLNAFESEVMRGHAQAAGLDNAVIVNTCAVTAEAERQARQAIRKARRENPEAMLIVTGCAAQIDPEGYASLPGVDRVLGNIEKLKAESFMPGGGARIQVSDIMAAKQTAGHLIEGFASRTRAFAEIQQGCNHRCTFCVIPFGRGNNRSVPMGEIVRQLRRLVENGTREVVLTGVDITDYGQDLPGHPSLAQLVRRILRNLPELPRLRLSSVDPAELDRELLAALAEEPRLMPHLHLSLQAGDDLVLKRMKRRHLMADVRRLAAAARSARPDVVFGADLIAGFPTETEAMFQRSLAAVEELGLTYLHVFPYSPRDGTPAARMPQVEKSLRKDRARRLRGAGAAALERFLDAQVGRSLSILVEDEGRGRSPQFAEVEVPGGQPGEIVDVVITARRESRLIGERLYGGKAA